MNVERLHAVAQAVATDIEERDIVSLLDQLVGALQNYIGSPQDSSHQLKVNELRDQVSSTLEDSQVNSFPPSWRQVLDELEISESLGNELAARIEEAFSQKEVTPAAVKPSMDEISKEVSALNESLGSLLSGLSDLGIGAEELEPGECEITVLIPRSAVEDGLKGLGNEFLEIQEILLPFSELATGSRPDFKVRTISSTDFSVFLDSVPATCACVAVAIERVLALYKNYLEIRKLQGDLREQKVPASALKGVKDHVNKLMKEGIEKLVDDLLEQFGQALEAGRKNELGAELRARLNAIANRIDKGYNIDVRAEPSKDENVPEEAKAEEKAALAIIKKASPNLKFMSLTGENLLSLPEDTDAAKRPARKRSSPPKRQRGSPNPPPQ